MMRHARYALSLLLAAGACRPAGRDVTDEARSQEPVSTPPDSTADPNDPWTAAAARGVVFRAVGNEPGWYAEVDAGAAPTMRLVLDYGERQLTVATSTPLPGDAGFRGEADGLTIELRIATATCSDGMSDAVYPHRVELTVGAQEYRGCGRKLP